MTVKEAATGDRLQQGLALLAPGNMHMVVQRDPKGYRVEVKDGPLVCYQKPSVDVMFASVAQAVGSRAIGVLLTGMGSDGANGLLAMKRAGAATMAQDEKSCVVFGMPKEAIRIGAVDQVVSLSKIAGTILKAASRPH
jgi:two-component system chemotaxis response regulator CheB